MRHKLELGMEMSQTSMCQEKLKKKNILRRLLSLVAYIAEEMGLFDTYYACLAHARYAIKSKRTNHVLDQQLIVSLTSYPPRYATLSLTLKTLLSQSVKPDLIVLWIYVGDLAKLPTSVTSLAGSDLQIRTTSRDTRSYKKLVHCLTAFPSAYIVTADDDVYYPGTWLAQLVAEVRPGKKEIVGHRGHCIALTPGQEIKPYALWELQIGSEWSKHPDRVMLTGCAGILYPPNSLHNEVLNEHAFNDLCPSADDLWFYFMARLNQYTCRVVSGMFHLRVWSSSLAAALYFENILGGQNDLAMEKLVATYGLPFSIDQFAKNTLK